MSSAFDVLFRHGLSKDIYGRADFLISPETKDLSSCIFAARPFPTRSAPVVLTGYSPRLLLASRRFRDWLRLEAARTNAAPAKN